jgi:hypothetical protein
MVLEGCRADPPQQHLEERERAELSIGVVDPRGGVRKWSMVMAPE